VYTIQIGESRLECPNAFSPDASEGINDEWKVSYKSIVSFECHIFNRYGQLMKHFNDPSQGWDGKYNGKFVPAGVYYYVIKARGSDGKKYDLSGDINIVKYN
ncbi:MAG: gliding motility-associated C-terminal domain-containing protein, partial [Paramuribaculum sp.]|nr:gliding motility-associated C-terminal domain-containing protein [Paramuribaculum sp.]